MSMLRREIADSPDYETYEHNFNFQKQYMQQRLRMLEGYMAGKTQKTKPEFGNK